MHVQRFLILWLLAALGRIAPAAELATFRESSGRSEAAGYRYLMWKPAGLEKSKRSLPLIVWLHGFSLRGDDLQKLKSYGPPAVLDRLGRADLALVAPQLPSTQLLWRPESLDRLLDQILREEAVDADRVVLAGASLGGAGVLEWAARSPERFLGIVVLAGAGNPSKADRIRNLPIWMFHGTADKQVPIRKARALEQALRESGGTVTLTELPDVGHDADALTQAAFLDHRAIDWLLGLKRSGHTSGAASAVRGSPDNAVRGSPDPAPVLQTAAEVRAAAERLKSALPDLPIRPPVPSDETIFAWIQGLCATPHRRPGTTEGQQAEAWVAATFRELGLEQVTADPVAIQVWSPERWSLSVDGREFASFFLLNSGFTPPDGVTAPLVYAAYGQLGQLRGADAKGKLVVVKAGVKSSVPQAGLGPWSYFELSPDGQPPSPTTSAAFPWNLLGDFLPIKITDAYERARSAGAAGLVVLTDELGVDGGSFYWPYDAALKPLPALYVSRGDSRLLLPLAEAGKTATLIQTGTVRAGTMANVWGVLPGASNNVLLVTSHHDSPHQGAVEDGSGMAQLLAQAWTWSRVPQEKRPLTMVFVAAAGHFYKGRGALEFARTHPDLMRRVRALVTLEHLPAQEVRRGSADAGRNGAGASPPGPDRDLPTGRSQPVHVYMPPHPRLVAAVWKALETQPPPLAVSAEKPLLSVPLSDAAGYVAWSRERNSAYPLREGLPYVSWISAPLYLVDAGDTLDKVERDKLSALAASVAEVIQRLLLLPVSP